MSADRGDAQFAAVRSPREIFAVMTCSTCGRSFEADTSPHRPFCSRRCQQLDLGRWLDEEVQVPHEGGPQSDEDARDGPVREIRFDED